MTTRTVVLVGLLAAAVCLASCSKSAPSIRTRAERVVDLTATGDFASATADFNSVMKSQLPADKLGQGWSQLTAQFGPFKARVSTRVAREQGYRVAYVTCQFERGDADVKIAFDNNGQIAGLFVVPSQSPSGGR